MDRKKPRKTTVFLVAVLALLGFAWAANALHLYALEHGLADMAKQKQEFVLPGEPEGETSNVTSTVMVSKAYALFGPRTAKIEVFSRYPTKDDSKFHYSEVEYVFAYEDGAWQELESAMCAGEECRKEATEAFANR